MKSCKNDFSFFRGLPALLLPVFVFAFFVASCSNPLTFTPEELESSDALAATESLEADAEARAITPQNGTMLQFFHWYTRGDGGHWNEVASRSPALADMGITAYWLPPAYKGAGGASDVGYGVYDMYDLGEFNQQGSVRTKYGTRSQYLSAINTARNNGIQVYGDVVFNHRGGADATEWVEAVRVERGNRNQEYGGTTWIQAWTRFDFPGRNNAYSSFKWRWYHFDGVDWAQNLGESSIFKFRGSGKAWDWEVDPENGNFDYLMYADLDMSHPEVVNELNNWGVWYVNNTNVAGFRIDAVKHIQFSFWPGWLNHVRNTTGRNLFAVGEYWSPDLGRLQNFINRTGRSMHLFDAPLHKNLYQASVSGGNYDMRNLMNSTLMAADPTLAVTLVENHDTQPLQALEMPVQAWFKPLAYAFITCLQFPSCLNSFAPAGTLPTAPSTTTWITGTSLAGPVKVSVTVPTPVWPLS